jgi:hypothetical protein
VTDKYLDETNPKAREKIPNGYLTSPIEPKPEKDDPNQMQQLDYSKLTPILTGAVQELKNEVDLLKNQINELTNVNSKQ